MIVVVLRLVTSNHRLIMHHQTYRYTAIQSNIDNTYMINELSNNMCMNVYAAQTMTTTSFSSITRAAPPGSTLPPRHAVF